MKSKIWPLTVAIAGLGACQVRSPHAVKPAESELPALSATLWSRRTELFMEYPPLVQGEQAAFAVHLTDLKSFRPLVEGKAILELEKDGKIVRSESASPLRPGIFRIVAIPGSPGRYRACLRVRAPNLEEDHDLGEIVVHPGKEDALKHTGPPQERGTAIVFLKEQQWGMEFATEEAALRKIPESIQVYGTVQPRGGGEGSAISPVRGRVLASPRLPLPGQRVSRGAIIAAILPFTNNPQDLSAVRLELSQARTDLDQARRQRERLEALLAERAIPARRVEDIKADEARALARVEAAQARLAQFETTRLSTEAEDPGGPAFQVRAPLAGVVTSVSAITGGTVEAGQEIAHVIAVDRVWVVAHVPEASAAALSKLRTGELEVPGINSPVRIPGPRGSIHTISRVVDPESRRIPVVLDVANEDGFLRIGQSIPVRLGIGEATERVSVPVSALVDDGGRSVVFVQIAGESFERRPVRTGPAGNGYVHILEGLKPGERVVSKGAYAIRLAALSTQIPAHGHVH